MVATNEMPQQHADELVDFRLVLAKLMRGRWWIVASVIAFGGAFTAVALLATPVYRATTILAPANEGQAQGALGSALGQLGGLASLAGIAVSAQDSATEEALAVLRSRQFTEAFLIERNLIPKLFARKWDAERKTWKVREDKIPTPAKAFKLFNKKMRKVEFDKKTGLVKLQIDWTDREEAAEWANELVARLNREMRARAIEKAEASVGFLEKEANETSTVAAREAISRLMEAQIKQRMLANVTEEYAFRVVDRALPADKDDPVRPQKLILIVAGILIGLVVGAAAALSAPGPLSRPD